MNEILIFIGLDMRSRQWMQLKPRMKHVQTNSINWLKLEFFFSDFIWCQFYFLRIQFTFQFNFNTIYFFYKFYDATKFLVCLKNINYYKLDNINFGIFFCSLNFNLKFLKIITKGKKTKKSHTYINKILSQYTKFVDCVSRHGIFIFNKNKK